MKALLVYPECPPTFWSYKYALSFVGKKAAIPPLGLLTIASMMPKDWEIKLIDMNAGQKLKDKHIKWADMVFTSAMIIQENEVYKIIERCKKLNVPISAGGPLFTSQPEKFHNVNHLILNEAEITFIEFLNDLNTGKLKRVYSTSGFADMSKTPIPMWSLINLNNYVTMPIQYSRGCPETCEFCDVRIMFGKVPRNKSPEQIIAELESLYRAGWRGAVFIVDDNFIGHKNKTKELLLRIIKFQKKHNYPFNFTTEATIRLASDIELMELMREANFIKVFVGIETVNIESLKECHKNQNIKVNLAEEVKKIQRYGMQVMAGFIVGFDNDSESVFIDIPKFIQETGIATAMVGMLTALPRTPLWHRLISEKRLLKDPTGENTDAALNFIPAMGKEKLLAGYKKILATIFEPAFYYQTLDKFIENYHQTRKGRMPKSNILAFLQSIFRIGVFSKQRSLYWKLIWKTFKTKPTSLAIAIELAIFGVHFHKTSEKVIKS